MMTPATTASRPRVEGERASEIHEAVVRLLVEHGYDKLTFDAVAAEVRASKATLYRKWPSKAALVVESVVETICPSVLERPDTGTLRGDLLSVACQDRGLTEGLPALIGAVMPALHRDEELFREVQARFIGPLLAEALTTFQRAQTRGEIGPDADLERLAGILPAMCVHQAVLFGRDCDVSDITAIVDQIVLPACRATLP
jgi:AcrR family transcriptional regulator